MLLISAVRKQLGEMEEAKETQSDVYTQQRALTGCCDAAEKFQYTSEDEKKQFLSIKWSDLYDCWSVLKTNNFRLSFSSLRMACRRHAEEALKAHDFQRWMSIWWPRPMGGKFDLRSSPFMGMLVNDCVEDPIGDEEEVKSIFGLMIFNDTFKALFADVKIHHTKATDVLVSLFDAFFAHLEAHKWPKLDDRKEWMHPVILVCNILKNLFSGLSGLFYARPGTYSGVEKTIRFVFPWEESDFENSLAAMLKWPCAKAFQTLITNHESWINFNSEVRRVNGVASMKVTVLDSLEDAVDACNIKLADKDIHLWIDIATAEKDDDFKAFSELCCKLQTEIPSMQPPFLRKGALDEVETFAVLFLETLFTLAGAGKSDVAEKILGMIHSTAQVMTRCSQTDDLMRKCGAKTSALQEGSQLHSLVAAVSAITGGTINAPTVLRLMEAYRLTKNIGKSNDFIKDLRAVIPKLWGYMSAQAVLQDFKLTTHEDLCTFLFELAGDKSMSALGDPKTDKSEASVITSLFKAVGRMVEASAALGTHPIHSEMAESILTATNKAVTEFSSLNRPIQNPESDFENAMNSFIRAGEKIRISLASTLASDGLALVLKTRSQLEKITADLVLVAKGTKDGDAWYKDLALCNGDDDRITAYYNATLAQMAGPDVEALMEEMVSVRCNSI
jgi:hypothetical protein